MRQEGTKVSPPVTKVSNPDTEPATYSGAEPAADLGGEPAADSGGHPTDSSTPLLTAENTAKLPKKPLFTKLNELSKKLKTGWKKRRSTTEFVGLPEIFHNTSLKITGTFDVFLPTAFTGQHEERPSLDR